MKQQELEVDVAQLKRRGQPGKGHSRSRRKSWLSLVFGLTLALAWHFIHQAGESYQPTPADPSFWYHLLVEATIAFYATTFCFIVWTLYVRFRSQ